MSRTTANIELDDNQTQVRDFDVSEEVSFLSINHNWVQL